MRHRSLPLSRFLPVVLFLLTVPAFAHHLPPGMEEIDEFSDSASFLIGFNHPLTGVDHLVVALLTGAAAARAGKAAGWLLTGAGLALLTGYVLGFRGLSMPGGEMMIAASVLISSLVMLRRFGRFPAALAALPAAFQLWHGNLHALEMPAGSGAGVHAAGAVSATVLLMVSGWALAMLYRQHTAGVPRRAIVSP